ncbi:MAG: hypothetical protein IPK02_05120 [Candidatus Accumulibacter sp.]|uniref:Uncharacterized protein n=1 Tax=Candidatus Accumulibacter affinis TaxID=2954384 RepID=A0A935T9H2_9PROT|nr:hypothetical protein [Candidatus Accumulibacter affinis]
MDDLAKVMEARGGESLEQVRERFKRWRETRGRGEHVPRELWAAAVGIARVHGLHVTARELHLDYGGLKRRQQEQAGSTLQAARKETQFVEWTIASARESGAQLLSECVIEMKSRRGAKMRVELNGPGLAGLTGLCSAFWSAA